MMQETFANIPSTRKWKSGLTRKVEEGHKEWMACRDKEKRERAVVQGPALSGVSGLFEALDYSWRHCCPCLPTLKNKKKICSKTSHNKRPSKE
jgi:hypothetical protein